MYLGWVLANPPVPDKQDKADEKQSTYFGSVGLQPTSPEEKDPELQLEKKRSK